MNKYEFTWKENKYKNKKCEYKGMKFDSKKEMTWFINLENMQKLGKITELERQVEFVLIETFRVNRKTYRKTKYIADFTYKTPDGKYHVVDVKSEATRKDKTYQLKKKLLAWKYGIEIEEV